MESIMSLHEPISSSCGKSTSHAPGESSNISLAIGKRFRTFQSVSHAIKTFCDENFQPFTIKRSIVFDSGSKYYHYKSITFSCVHSGVSKQRSNGIQPRQSILHTDCPAEIKVRLYNNPCLHYKIYHLNLHHNHEISSEQYFLYSKEPCLSKEDKAFLFEIMASNATNKDIKLFIQDVMNKKPTTRDILNLRAQFKRSESSVIDNGEQITYCKAMFAKRWNMLQKQENNPKFLKIYKQLDDLYFGSSNSTCTYEQSKASNIRKKVPGCDNFSKDATAENVNLLPLGTTILPEETRKNNLPTMNTSQKYLLAKLYTDKLATLLSQCSNRELEPKLKILSFLIQAWEYKENVSFSKSKNGVLKMYSKNQSPPSEEDNINNSEEDNINNSEEDNISNSEEEGNICYSEQNAKIDVAVSPEQNNNINMTFSPEQNKNIDVPFSPEQNNNINMAFSPELNKNIDVPFSPEQNEPPTYETIPMQNYLSVENTKNLLTDEYSDVSQNSANMPEFEESSPCKEFQISSTEKISCEASIPHEILPCVETDDSSAFVVPSEDVDILNQTQNYELHQKILIPSQNILFPKGMKTDHISPIVLMQLKNAVKNTNTLYRIRRLFKKILPKSEDTAELRTNAHFKRNKKFKKRARRPPKLALPNNLRKILPKLVPTIQGSTGVSSIQEQNGASTGETVTLPQDTEPSLDLEQSEECVDIFHNSSTDIAIPTRSSPSKELHISEEQAPSNPKESETLSLPVNENLLPDCVRLSEVETNADSSDQILNNPLTVENDTQPDPVLLAEPPKAAQKRIKSKKSKHKNVLGSSSDVDKLTKRMYHKRLKSSAKGKSAKPFTLPDLSRNILHISHFKDKIAELRTITMHKKLENLTNNLTDGDIEDILSGKMLNEKIMNVGQILMHLKFPEACGLQDVSLGSTLEFKTVTSKFIQIIYCKEPVHWITISTLTSPDTVYVYDSLDEIVPRDAIPQICNIMNVQSPTLTIISQPMQLASNNADCGLFALASAITLLNEKDPSETVYDVNAFRQHLMSGVIKKDLQEFPTLNNVNVVKSARKFETFDLFCLCRQPLLTDMCEIMLEQIYQCQMCKDVFHIHCKSECCNVAPLPFSPISI